MKLLLTFLIPKVWSLGRGGYCSLERFPQFLHLQTWRKMATKELVAILYGLPTCLVGMFMQSYHFALLVAGFALPKSRCKLQAM